MSWDVIFSSNRTMGTKESVREKYLSVCETVTGTSITRKGPTEVTIDESFDYEIMFIGHKRAVESLVLSININSGNPVNDTTHPVWNFIKTICTETEWTAFDTFTGEDITL